MANELKATFALSATSGPSIPLTIIRDTWVASQGCADIFLLIGTTEETVSFVDVTNNGWVMLHNLDATNYVEIGFSTGVYGIRVKAGERSLFRLNAAATLYAKANTAACRLRVVHFGGV